MTRFRLFPHALLAAVSVAALFVVPADAQRRDDRRYGVAVVRADGILIPFAEYDRDKWREIWAAKESGGYALPITLNDIDDDWWGHVDPSSVWQLWRRPGVSEVLTVTGLRTARTPCGAVPGLTTTHKSDSPPPAPDIVPYPKAGLATTAGVDFTPIVSAEPGTPAWDEVRTAVEGAFDDLEADQLYRMQWAHPVRARDRRDAPVTLKSAVHTAGSRFYYVEATRAYVDPDPPKDAPPCGLVTFISGFFWRNGRGELVPAGMNTLVTYCHLEDARYLWPLGAIREGDDTYWAVQAAGWTGEGYGLLELDESKGVVKTSIWHNAGECRER